MLNKLLDWDHDTLIYLNNLGSEKYDAFWSLMTNFSTWTPLFIIFILALMLKFPKKEALYKILWILTLGIFISLFMHFTKEIFGRIRPNNDLEINSMLRILRRPKSFSFFSGHASSSFSITVLVFLFLRKKMKWSLLFFIWPILFSYSRIYAGVHYPLDILVGTLVGILVGVLFYKSYIKLIVPYSKSAHLESRE